MTNEHAEQLKDLLQKTAGILSSAPGVKAIIVIAVTDEVTDDDTKRRVLTAMGMKSDYEKWQIYMQIGIETLQKSVKDGPIEQAIST